MPYPIKTVLPFIPLIIFATFLFQPTNAYKILLYPCNMKSHFIYFGEFAKALLDGNHEVHMLVASNTDLPSSLHPDIKILRFSVQQLEPYSQSETHAANIVRTVEASDRGFFELARVTMETYQALIEKLTEECEDFLSDKALMSQLKNNSYDVAMYDPVEMTCAGVLWNELKVPMVTMMFPAFPWVYRVPVFFSATPSTYSGVSDGMTFLERLKNVLMELNMMRYIYTPNSQLNRTVYGKDIMIPAELLQHTTLLFYMHETVTHYPRPVMPNTIEVGDLMMREGKPLPKEYSTLVNHPENPVILMSLGSYFKQLPSHWEQKFCDAFNIMRPNIQVIWKTSIRPDCDDLPRNIHIRPWVPQNDLLAHPNVKVFITHMGWNSYMEAAYHGTPMVAFPMFTDQPYNAIAAENKGLAIRLSITKFEPFELVDAIHGILEMNSTYTQNAGAISRMLHHRAFTARDKINYWIEHVVLFGGKHLRNSGFDMSLVEFLMLDIVVFLFVIILILIMLILCLVIVGFKAIRYFLCNPMKIKEKYE